VPYVVQGPITEAEFALACEVLEKTGSESAALLVFSRGAVDADNRPSRRTTFKNTLRRNPAWQARWDDAKSAALAWVEQSIADACRNPDRKPIFDKAGRLLGYAEDSCNKNWMLMNMARRLDPAAWSERRRLEVDGQVDVKHSAVRPSDYTLSAEDVFRLSPADQQALFALLQKVEEGRQPQLLPGGVVDER
jgi:hypothetical protein